MYIQYTLVVYSIALVLHCNRALGAFSKILYHVRLPDMKTSATSMLMDNTYELCCP